MPQCIPGLIAHPVAVYGYGVTDGVLSPVAIGPVVCRLFAVGVEQEVAIHQNHCSMFSRSACLWSRVIPGHMPVSCMVMVRTRLRISTFSRCLMDACRASSMTFMVVCTICHDAPL